jgi:hypothetical protein
MDEKHFFFNDSASPTYMLVNTEVAEGDLLEALPALCRRLGIWFAAAILFGGINFLFSSQQVPLNLCSKKQLFGTTPPRSRIWIPIRSKPIASTG